MHRLGAAILILCLAGSACHASPARPTHEAPITSGRLMAPEKVADHVWVMRQPDRVWSAVIGNVGIVEQSTGIILFDTGGTIEDGKDVLAALDKLSSKPVRAVIVSHWHNDHPLGLPALIARYPNVRIIATSRAATDMAKAETLGVGIGKTDPAKRDERFKIAEERAADYLKSSQDPNLSDDERREFAIEAPWVLVRGRRQLENFVVVPNETFTDRLMLDDPVAPIEVLFLGRANTRGDAFAWLPRQKVMFTGDAVVAPTPYGFTAPTAPWLATLDKLETYPFTTLVPGHGKVQRERDYLATLRWSMQDIDRQARLLAATEPDADTAFKRFDQAEQRRRFEANSGWVQRWLEGYWLGGMFETAFNAAKGTGKDDKVD